MHGWKSLWACVHVVICIATFLGSLQGVPKGYVSDVLFVPALGDEWPGYILVTHGGRLFSICHVTGQTMHAA